MTPQRPRRNSHETLRREFRAALAWYGMTAEDFAARQPVTPHHLSLVLAQKRESVKLLDAVRAFVAQFKREVAKQSAGGAQEPHISQYAA